MGISIYLIKQKIDEYILLLEESGLVNDKNTLNMMKNKLNSLKIDRIYNAPGDAVIDGTTLKICYENIEKNIRLSGEYYLDEVLFHEFSHMLNSFHNAIYGKDSFIIRDFIVSKMDFFTTPELLEQFDNLLYNQDPCFGISLLDEYTAQYIAQKLTYNKFEKLSDKEKKNYSFINLNEYKIRTYKTNICEPPMIIKTSFASYPEFYPFALEFINKYGYTNDRFIKESLKSNFVKKLINESKSKKIYIDLCYLGIIRQRVYLLKGYQKISDLNDAACNARKVNEVMTKILKRAN